MPKGPQGQKRPADAVANAVMVARIATGEIVETLSPTKGSSGGRARSAALTPERKKQIAKAGAEARWSVS